MPESYGPAIFQSLVLGPKRSTAKAFQFGQKFAVDKMNMAKTALLHSGFEARGPAQGPTSPMPRAGSELMGEDLYVLFK